MLNYSQGVVTQEETNRNENKSVLIVEGEEAIAYVIEQALKNWGYTAEKAYSGRSALEKIKEGEYSLIIIDLKLPDISGLEVYHYFRANKPEIAEKFLFMLITGTIDNFTDFIEGSRNLYLLKPPTMKTL